MAGLVVPTLASLASMRYLWHTPYRLDNTRLQALIGQEPHTPFDQAVCQALAALDLPGLGAINPPAIAGRPA